VAIGKRFCAVASHRRGGVEHVLAAVRPGRDQKRLRASSPLTVADAPYRPLGPDIRLPGCHAPPLLVPRYRCTVLMSAIDILSFFSVAPPRRL